MRHLIRRAWWTRKVAGKPQTNRVHLFVSGEYSGVFYHAALCGVSIPWILRPEQQDLRTQYQANGCQGELLTDPGPEVESRVCRRCERYAKLEP